MIRASEAALASTIAATEAAAPQRRRSASAILTASRVSGRPYCAINATALIGSQHAIDGGQSRTTLRHDATTGSGSASIAPALELDLRHAADRVGDEADLGRAVVEPAQLRKASRRAIGGNAGEQAAGGLRIDQQSRDRIGRVCRAGVESGQCRNVVGMQRAGDAAVEKRQSAVERRDRLGIEHGVHIGGAQHFEKVAEEAEPGHVGAGGGAICQQTGGGGGRGLHHRRDRALDDARRRNPARIGREDHPGAERLGQDQPVAGAQPALAQQLPRPRSPGHGKAESQLGTLGTVPADQHGSRRFEHVEPAAQHVKEVVLDDRRARRRQGGDRQRALRRAPHRVDVAERMSGGDPSEQIGVVDHRAEEIDGLQQWRRTGERDQRGVVRAVEPDHHRVARRRLQPLHDPASTAAGTLAAQPPQRIGSSPASAAAFPAIRGSAASSADRSSP